MNNARRAFAGRSELWKNQDFIRFWIGETIANFGAYLGLVALPIIAAVTLDASPFQMGLLAASTNLPRMIVGIFAGSWVDRRKRRPVMITVNLTRALTLLLVPLAAWLDLLTYPLLLGVAVLLGAQGILFDSAWSAMVPNLVPRRDLADANGKLWASMSLAQIAGPALAGTLIAWLTGPWVLAINAATFVASAWFMWKIEKPETDFGTRTRMATSELLASIREGYAELINNPITRPLTTTLVMIGMGGGVFGAVYLLFLTRELELDTRWVGYAYAAGGVGALIGSMVAAPLARTFGYGKTILWSGILQGLMNISIPLAFLAGRLEIGIVFLAVTGAWVLFQAYDINRFSLRQSITRADLMGRVASSTMTILAAATMFGAFSGGIIGQVLGIRPTLVIGGLVMAIGMWTMWDSPVPGIVHLPEPEDVPEIPIVEEAPAQA